MMIFDVRYEVVTAVNTEIAAFWDVASFNQVEAVNVSEEPGLSLSL
jgi:hypothetical protein